MRFPVRFIEMYEDLFVEDKNLPKRLGNNKLENIEMVFDTDLDCVIVKFKNRVAMIPKTSCKQIVPSSNATLWPDVVLPAGVPIDEITANTAIQDAINSGSKFHGVNSAQVEDPTKPARGRKTQ